MPLSKNAFQDKKDLISHTENYLQTYRQPVDPSVNILEYRKEVIDAVNRGDFTQALQNLEKLLNAKTNIVMHEINKDGKTPVIIRDARRAFNPRVRETESFEMQYLNAIRAAMDIADIESKPYLKEQLQLKASKFIQEFHKDNRGKSQKDISKEVTKEIDVISKFLGDEGIANAHKKLDVAKDFQNFKDKHANIVTISEIEYEGKTDIVIEAEVALRGLTQGQQKEYQSLKDNANKPKWYTKMPEWEQKLVQKYTPTIQAGHHVIPTQLRQIVGMKNAFEKITAIVEPIDQKLKILHTSKHAGTLASLSRDKGSRQDITEQNAMQAQEWIGSSRKLHINTLNSGPIGAGDDPEIVERSKIAMKAIGAKMTNTAFNALRLFGMANDLSGVQHLLKEIADNFKGKEFDIIKTHIEPRGMFSKLFGLNKPQGNASAEINKLRTSGKIDDETTKILQDSIDLRKTVEKANVWFRMSGDKENVNLSVSKKLNYLTKEITNSTSDLLSAITKYEILTMCASGKDRTGLSEHDKSASVISKLLDIPISIIDDKLLIAGHTAGQAGSVYSGGATIGCYGTKGETAGGIPKSRIASLKPIMEVSAGNNKIKGDSKKTDTKYKANKQHSSNQHQLQEVKLIDVTNPDFSPKTERIKPDSTPEIIQKKKSQHIR
jgi:hypothetical protein